MAHLNFLERKVRTPLTHAQGKIKRTTFQNFFFLRSMSTFATSHFEFKAQPSITMVSSPQGPLGPHGTSLLSPWPPSRSWLWATQLPSWQLACFLSCENLDIKASNLGEHLERTWPATWLTFRTEETRNYFRTSLTGLNNCNVIRRAFFSGQCRALPIYYLTPCTIM